MMQRAKGEKPQRYRVKDGRDVSVGAAPDLQRSAALDYTANSRLERRGKRASRVSPSGGGRYEREERTE